MIGRAPTRSASASEVKEWLRQRLVEDFPSLLLATADELLAEARADPPRTARQIVTYLIEHPQGLLTPDASCPLGLVRLTQVLAAHGYPVPPPACTGCGRRVHLSHQGPRGRVCNQCHDAARPIRVCSRCGRGSMPIARFGEERLCRNCYRKEPGTHRQCSICGRMRPIENRGSNGEPVCPTCAQRPLRTCIDCGRQRPAQAVTPQGPVCATCYPGHQKPRRCGRCGNLAPITARASSDSPDMCHSCWESDYGKRRRAAQPRTLRPPARERPTPRTKLPRFATCSLCDRTRPITVYWPIGPICGSCCPKAKDHPNVCHGCSKVRVLVAKDEQGQWICGQCSGSSRFDYRCRRCGLAGRVIHDGQCYRCCVDIRLHELLADGEGRVPPQLSPLVAALLAAQKPRSVWVWLNRSAAPQLLADLAARPGPITHAMLDSLPPSRAIHFIRRMLIDSGVLPDRMDHLDRLGPWLDALLKSRPPAQVRIIRPYAQWHLLRRARRRAQHRGDRPGAAYKLRQDLYVALEFLDWLDHRDVPLATLTQREVDAWLVEAVTARPYRARDFLQWAVRNQLAPKGVVIPARTVGPPKIFADADDYAAQLRRCFTDDDLPTDVRAAGALILLFGLRTVDVVALRREQLTERNGDHFLALNGSALLIPPALAALLKQLPLPRNINRAVVQRASNASPLLFPGFTDNRPIDAGRFGSKLLKHGLNPLGGRSTGRLALAADLPASVLADLLGIHNGTATRWAQRTRRDWHSYLAHRRQETDPLHGGSK